MRLWAIRFQVFMRMSSKSPSCLIIIIAAAPMEWRLVDFVLKKKNILCNFQLARFWPRKSQKPLSIFTGLSPSPCRHCLRDKREDYCIGVSQDFLAVIYCTMSVAAARPHANTSSSSTTHYNVPFNCKAETVVVIIFSKDILTSPFRFNETLFTVHVFC